MLPDIQPYWRRSGLYCFAYCQKFSLTGEGQDYTALHTARNSALLETVRIILLCILPEIQPYWRRSGLYCFAYCQKFSLTGEGQDYTALHTARNSALPEKVRIILLCILPEIQHYWRRSGLYCFSCCQKFSFTLCFPTSVQLHFSHSSPNIK